LGALWLLAACGGSGGADAGSPDTGLIDGGSCEFIDTDWAAH